MFGKSKILVAGLLVAFGGSCDTAPQAGAGGTGSVALALVSQLPDGSTYRLTSAKFEITGTGIVAPDMVVVDGSGNTQVVRRTLRSGVYNIELEDGWRLERLLPDGTGVPVEAVLASKNPASLTILRGAETQSKWDFLLRAPDGMVAISFGVIAPSGLLGLFYPDPGTANAASEYDFEVYFPVTGSKTGEELTDKNTSIKFRTYEIGPTAVNWIGEAHPLLAGIKGEIKLSTELKIENVGGQKVYTVLSHKWSGLKLEGTGVSPQYSKAGGKVTESWSFEPSEITWVSVGSDGFPAEDIKFSSWTRSSRSYTTEAGQKIETSGNAWMNLLSPTWLARGGWDSMPSTDQKLPQTWTAPAP